MSKIPCGAFRQFSAVCCAHNLYAFGVQIPHLQPDMYFVSGTRPDTKCSKLYFPLTQKTLRGFFYYLLFLLRYKRIPVETLIILKKMVVWGDGIVQPYVWTFFSAIVVAVCTIVAIRRSRDNFVVKKGIRTHVVEGYYPIVDLTKFWSLFAFILFVGFTICIAYTGISPFIYFQF